MKILPCAEWETETEAKVTVPKVFKSRRHNVKVMFMRIIDPPVCNK